MARETAQRGLADGLIVSGPATGQPAANTDVLTVRRAVPDGFILVGSGVDENNIWRVLEHADGAIIGTSLKYNGQNSQPNRPGPRRTNGRNLRNPPLTPRTPHRHPPAPHPSFRRKPESTRPAALRASALTPAYGQPLTKPKRGRDVDPDFHRGDGVGPPPTRHSGYSPHPGPPVIPAKAGIHAPARKGGQGQPINHQNHQNQTNHSSRQPAAPTLHSALRTPHSALRTPHPALHTPPPRHPPAPRHSGESRKPRTPIQHSPLPIPNPPVSSSPRPTTKTPEARKGGQGQPKNHQKSPKSNESQFKTTRRPHSALPPTRHSGESRNPRTQTNHSSRQTPRP